MHKKNKSCGVTYDYVLDYFLAECKCSKFLNRAWLAVSRRFTYLCSAKLTGCWCELYIQCTDKTRFLYLLL